MLCCRYCEKVFRWIHVPSAPADIHIKCAIYSTIVEDTITKTVRDYSLSTVACTFRFHTTEINIYAML